MAQPVFFQVELNVLKYAGPISRQAGLQDEDRVHGALNRIWGTHVFTRRLDTLTLDELRGFFYEWTEFVPAAMVSYGFLERLQDGRFRVKGASRYIGKHQQQRAAGESRAATGARGPGGTFRRSSPASNQRPTSASPATAGGDDVGSVASGPRASRFQPATAGGTAGRNLEEIRDPRSGTTPLTPLQGGKRPRRLSKKDQELETLKFPNGRPTTRHCETCFEGVATGSCGNNPGHWLCAECTMVVERERPRFGDDALAFFNMIDEWVEQKRASMLRSVQ